MFPGEFGHGMTLLIQGIVNLQKIKIKIKININIKRISRASLTSKKSL